MKVRSLFFISMLMLVLSGGCKSAFEKVRTSNDPVRILAEANKYYAEEDWLKSQALYELVIPYYRGKKEAEDLFYKYAYTYYHQEQYLLAAHYFDNFAKTFYNSEHKEEMAFQAAYANYLMSPNHKLDQTPSVKAIEQLQTFINTYPSSPRVDECNKLIDELRSKLELKSIEQGQLYFDLKNYQAAISSLENTLKDFPETKKAEDLRYLIVMASAELADKSIYEKMQERLDQTIVLSEKFIKKYPDSSKIGEMRDVIDNCNKELKRFIK